MTAAQVAPSTAQPAPRRRPGRGGRHLQIVTPTKRRSPAVPVLFGVGIVLTALFALAVMHALMIGRQLQLDDMNRDLAAETESVERLRLRVAELEAPDRVLDVARERLGMVEPGEVGYVLPGEVTSVTEEAVRVSPATVPTTTVPVRQKSAEKAEVDAAATTGDAASAGTDPAAQSADANTAATTSVPDTDSSADPAAEAGRGGADQ